MVQILTVDKLNGADSHQGGARDSDNSKRGHPVSFGLAGSARRPRLNKGGTTSQATQMMRHGTNDTMGALQGRPRDFRGTPDSSASLSILAWYRSRALASATGVLFSSAIFALYASQSFRGHLAAEGGNFVLEASISNSSEKYQAGLDNIAPLPVSRTWKPKNRKVSM